MRFGLGILAHVANALGWHGPAKLPTIETRTPIAPNIPPLVAMFGGNMHAGHCRGGKARRRGTPGAFGPRRACDILRRNREAQRLAASL